MIKRVDGGDINTLSKGSNKKIVFLCEKCNKETIQSYRNFRNQKENKLCRSCRNKHTSNLFEVKEKQSLFQKNRWMNIKYREEVSTKISNSQKNNWKNNIERKKNLSENNPMKNNIWKKKQSENSSTSIETLKELCESYGYVFIERVLGKRGGTRILYKCYNGHIQEKRLDSFRSGSWRCNECSKKFSFSEKEIGDFISQYFYIIKNDRCLISPYEIDIFIPDKKIAIEYCGLYWHGEKYNKLKLYHLKKQERMEELGYRLITIFEDEWINKRHIVEKRLKHILGISDDPVVYGRQTEVKNISYIEAKSFIDENHIQGWVPCKIKLGLFHDKKLVSVMTFSKGSIAKGEVSIDGVWELSRFCSSINVVGGAGKLLHFFKKNYKWTKIYSFADRRWSIGNLYYKLGFSFEKNTSPNYWYYKDVIKRIHRFSFRKNKISHMGTGTEWEIMKKNGYDRIWDCGNMKFILQNECLHSSCRVI